MSKYTNIVSQDIQFDYNHKGKPSLLNIYKEINFNLSHKNNYTIYGFSKLNLGVDLEVVKSDIKVPAIAQRFFSENEYQDLAQFNQSEQLSYFFQLWTAKEAYLKAIGEGLSGGLDSIELSKNYHQQEWQIKLLNASEQESKLWQIKTISLPDNYLMSWAVKSTNNLVVKYYKIDDI